MAKTETRFGTFDDLLANAAAAQRPIAQRLREIVQELHSDTTEVVRLGDNAATFGIGPKKMSEGYCYIMPLKSRVNLGFYHGVNLQDPASLLEGTGKKLRHVKINSLADANRVEVRQLIAESIAERRSALGCE